MKLHVAALGVFVIATAILAGGQTPAAFDWPQWRGPDRTGSVERDRASEAVARRRDRRGVDDLESRRRLWLGRRQGRSHLRSVPDRPAEHRRQPEPRRRQDCLVEGRSGPAGNNDRGPGTARHADRRWRSPLRPYRERRPGLPRSCRTAAMLWQRNILKDFSGRNISLADQRIAAGRRQQCDRHARRPRRRHCRAGQDDREDRLDQQGTERRGRLRLRRSPPTCRACAPS